MQVCALWVLVLRCTVGRAVVQHGCSCDYFSAAATFLAPHDTRSGGLELPVRLPVSLNRQPCCDLKSKIIPEDTRPVRDVLHM